MRILILSPLPEPGWLHKCRPRWVGQVVAALLWHSRRQNWLCQFGQSTALWPGLQNQGFCFCQGGSGGRWAEDWKEAACYLKAYWLWLLQSAFSFSKSLCEHWLCWNNQHSLWLAEGWVRILNSSCRAGEMGTPGKEDHDVSSLPGLIKMLESMGWVCSEINAFKCLKILGKRYTKTNLWAFDICPQAGRSFDITN